MNDSEATWYEEKSGIFSDDYDYLETYSYLEERTKKEVDFVEKALDLEKPVRILDVPCGHGRHAIELARRGYSVAGQDLHEYFLEKAAKDAREEGLDVEFRQGDMRNLQFSSSFDVTLNLFTSFGYLSEESEDRRFLQTVYNSLKPNGKFLLDFINRERVMRDWQPKDWSQYESGVVELHEREYNFETGRLNEVRTKIYPDGSRKKVRTSLRLYSLSELVGMCERVGMSVLDTYGNFDGDPVSFDSSRAIIVAQKS